jgi:hypothetical protein
MAGLLTAEDADPSSAKETGTHNSQISAEASPPLTIGSMLAWKRPPATSIAWVPAPPILARGTAQWASCRFSYNPTPTPKGSEKQA